ncbi:hypothetical protein [Streptomyces cacaoi]|uniref:Uncharacterized protein n=1 Tax=Streptomyces cacaoi TaxID=1898 RepID=A0A4Y3R0T1_STRCI|nr:hypothetical protein [Streptomyces cacaoi]NNG84900.1 hypothetical protein [Streptomyces cacaoi]GEB50288.1 hypothetical protein SCA03_28390 [Streptomyces cacaoi]
MSQAERLQDQLATDLTWMMGGAIYGLLVAPTLVRWAYTVYVWVALRRRRRRGAPRALGGRLRMLARLEAAMAEFRLPFALRGALRERLMKAQVLATATAVVIGCPALVLFNLTTLDAHAADGKIPGLTALITTVAAVLLFALTAVGGAARVYGPRLGLPVTRMVCNALITAHRVRRREASPSRLDSAVDAVAAVLVHRAKKYHVRQERPATIEHAKRVREALRWDARRVQRGDAGAVDELAGKLATVLHGLCAGTPQNLLPESLLVSSQVAHGEPRKRVAFLASVGVALASALAWLLSAVGVPGEAVVPLTIVTLVLPLKLGGPSEPPLRARDLLDFARGDSEPPATAQQEPEERQPTTASRE